MVRNEWISWAPESGDPRGASSGLLPTKTLVLIQTSFNARDELIERPHGENRIFQELCRDDHRCVTALHRWTQREASTAVSRSQEHTELIIERGREIQGWLDAMERDLPDPAEDES